MELQDRIRGCSRGHDGAGALFTALAKRIRRFTIVDEEPLLNNVLRGFKTLRVAGH
jgi:hypothetical protein